MNKDTLHPFENETLDFRAAFNALPGMHAMLLTDAPKYTIVAVTDEFIDATGVSRKDLIGKGLMELFPADPHNSGSRDYTEAMASLEAVVLTKKESRLPELRYDLQGADGTFEERYWTVINKPVLDKDGSLQYIIHTTTEITEQVRRRRQDQELRLVEQQYHFFMQAPVIIAVVKGENHVIALANKSMLQLWGRGEEVIGKPLLEAIPELEGQGFIERLNEVRLTGKIYQTYENPSTLIRNGKVEVRYLDFIYQPYYDLPGDEKATGVIGIAHDVTEQVIARRKVEEVKERLDFRNALYEAQNEVTPDGVLLVDGKGKTLLHNKRFAEIWKMPQSILEAGDDEAALAHAKGQLTDPEGFLKKVQHLYENGMEKSHDHIHFKDGRIIERYGTPIITEKGVRYGWAWYFRDISDRLRQEQKFRNVVEQAPDPILILKGEELVLEMANQALLDLWQIDETSINKTFLEILPEMKDQGFPDLLLQVLRTGVPFYGYAVPAVFKRKGGEEETVYFNFSYKPYHESDGTITGVLILANNVTEQVMARKELEKSEQELKGFKLLADLAQDPFILMRQDGSFAYLNKKALAAWGYTEDESDRLRVPHVDPVYHDEAYAEIFARAQREAIPQFETLHKRKNGEIFPVEINMSGLTLAGEPHLFAVARDITDRKKYEELILQNEADLQTRVTERTMELEDLNQELKRSNSNLEEFAYAASHDMKEPIRKIHFFSDRLKSELADRLDDNQHRLFSRMEEAARRMSALIDDLLMYSHISRGAAKDDMVNLTEVISTALEDLELEFQEKKARITVDPVPSLKGHKRQLQQLFQNLISNALKYSRDGVPSELYIRYSTMKGTDIRLHLPYELKRKQYHHIEVVDNGIGFSPEDAERIFNVFTRLHGNAEYRGTGVGLSIARKVVENHNGFLWAEGRPGEGATFHVMLPME